MTRRSMPPAAMWAAWLVTRAGLYLVALAPRQGGDVGIYQGWYACCFAHGTYPLADPLWQYPPGAALVFWLPGRLPGSYLNSFVLLMITCDLGITLALWRAARRGGSWAGPWFWVCGVPLLGAIALTRFDLVPVALSVAALCVTGPGVARGVLAGVGAAVKAWPVTLLAGVAPGRGRRALAGAAAVLAVVAAVYAGPTVGFLTHQHARGVEIESVAATPFMIWRQAGWPGTIAYRFGAWQLSGPHAALAQDASRLGLVLTVAAVLGWRLLLASGRATWRPEFAADAPLAVTLLVLVTGSVLSAQYLLWVTGLAAACLVCGQTTQRPVALAVLAADVLTQLVFPFGWRSLLQGSDPMTGVLTARNVLLVAAAAVSCWRVAALSLRRPAAADHAEVPAARYRVTSGVS